MRQQFRDSTMVLYWRSGVQVLSTKLPTLMLQYTFRMIGSNTVPVALIYMSGEISANIVTVITRANTSLTQFTAIV